MIIQTHFQNVLNTNYAASSSEIGQIRELLAQPIQELNRLNSEINHLKSTLGYLFSQRDKLQQFVSSHKALISPIRRLPTEVLSEIFVHSLQQNNRNPTRSLGEAPLLLTLVCKQWRAIALNTARLWQSLHVYVPPTAPRLEKKWKEVMERRSEGVKAWLSRSGSLPLSISLVVGPNRDRNAANPLMKPLLDILFSFSSRWGNISFRIPASLLKSVEENVKPEDLAMLRTLTVDYDMATRQFLVFEPSAQESQEIPLGRLICNAPALHELTVYEPLQNVYNLDLDWSKLTHFRAETALGGSQKPRDLLRVLSKGALNLQHVHISAGFRPPYPTVEEEADTPVITLSSLHTLTLILQFDLAAPAVMNGIGNPGQPGAQPDPIFGSQIDVVFKGIAAPNLKNLVLRYGNAVDLDEGHAPPQLPFLQFLLRSECQLESLDIGFIMTKDALVECLSNPSVGPSLKALTIEECVWPILRDRQRLAFLHQHNPPPATTPENIAEHAMVTDDVLQRFIPDENGTVPPLCPGLERLTLSRIETVSESMLVKLAQSRTHTSPEPNIEAQATPEPPAETGNSSNVLPTLDNSEPPRKRTFPVATLHHLSASFQREKSVITEEDTNARKEMKTLKKSANVNILVSYPKPPSPSDLPHSGQQPREAVRTSALMRSLFWD